MAIGVYSPMDTLRLFVGQVLSADRACQDVVGRRLSERVRCNQTHNTLNTASYCQARARLPLAIPEQLGARIGARLEANAPCRWRWQGRSVKIFDATVVSMPDTQSNQQAFPQNSQERAGLGFPKARIGALIALASGAVLSYVINACKGKGSGEQSMLHQLLPWIEAGDVILADRLLASWWLIHDIEARGADLVMPQHARRATDFRRGRGSTLTSQRAAGSSILDSPCSTPTPDRVIEAGPSWTIFPSPRSGRHRATSPSTTETFATRIGR